MKEHILLYIFVFGLISFLVFTMFINYKEGLDEPSQDTDASPNGDDSNGKDSNGNASNDDASTETDTSSSNENSTDNPSSKADAESIKQAMNFDAMPAGSIMSNASASQTGAMTNIMLGSSEVPGANKSTGSSVKAGGASTLGGFNVCLAVSPLDPNDKNQVPPTSGPSETETMSNEAVESPLDTILEQGNSTSGKEETSSSASNVNPTCSFGTYYNTNQNSCASCAGKWEAGIESCITNDDYWVLGIISMSADASGCNILPSNTYFATKELVREYGVQTQLKAQLINDDNISLGEYNKGWTFTDISSSDVREAGQVNWSVDPVPTNYASQKSSETNIAPLEGCDVSTRNKKWVVAKAGKSVTKGDNGYPELKDNNSGWEWENGSVSLLPVEATKSWEKSDSDSGNEGESTQ